MGLELYKSEARALIEETPGLDFVMTWFRMQGCELRLEWQQSYGGAPSGGPIPDSHIFNVECYLDIRPPKGFWFSLWSKKNSTHPEVKCTARFHFPVKAKHPLSTLSYPEDMQRKIESGEIEITPK